MSPGRGYSPLRLCTEQPAVLKNRGKVGAELHQKPEPFLLVGEGSTLYLMILSLKEYCENQAKTLLCSQRHWQQATSLHSPKSRLQSVAETSFRSYITRKQWFQVENISDATILSVCSLAIVCTSSNKHFPNQLVHLEPTHQSLSSRIQFAEPLVI